MGSAGYQGGCRGQEGASRRGHRRMDQQPDFSRTVCSSFLEGYVAVQTPTCAHSMHTPNLPRPAGQYQGEHQSPLILHFNLLMWSCLSLTHIHTHTQSGFMFDIGKSNKSWAFLFFTWVMDMRNEIKKGEETGKKRCRKVIRLGSVVWTQQYGRIMQQIKE